MVLTLSFFAFRALAIGADDRPKAWRFAAVRVNAESTGRVFIQTQPSAGFIVTDLPKDDVQRGSGDTFGRGARGFTIDGHRAVNHVLQTRSYVIESLSVLMLHVRDFSASGSG
nr:hypothetical protein [Mycolicibacterium komanii]